MRPMNRLIVHNQLAQPRATALNACAVGAGSYWRGFYFFR